jgi:hypothetical protein
MVGLGIQLGRGYGGCVDSIVNPDDTVGKPAEKRQARIGIRGWPGVYRFNSHEEADQWLIDNTIVLQPAASQEQEGAEEAPKPSEG